mgnify:FL=1
MVLLAWLACSPAVMAEAPDTPRSPAPGILLVADEGLRDPGFARSVILLTHYSLSDGAFGLILNQPTGLQVRDILADPEAAPGYGGRLFRGGPVSPQGIWVLIRSQTPHPHATQVLDDIQLTTSRDALRSALDQGNAEDVRVFAGYAGWAAGQLERELQRGDWHLAEANSGQVLAPDTPDLWRQLRERARQLWVQRPNTGQERPIHGTIDPQLT